MNLSGQMLRVHVPELVRRRALRELFASTASALGSPMPALRTASADEILVAYAMFTAQHAAAALRDRDADLALIRERLYSAAYRIGSRLRRDLGISSVADTMAAARALYGMLRIDFRQAGPGEVRIERCFFSRFYSPEVCRLMSSVDMGLMAGLNAGGRLVFRQRITEGALSCAGTFTEPSL